MTTFKLFGTEISVLKEREDEIPPIPSPLSQLPCPILTTIEGMKGRGLVSVMRKTLTTSDVFVHQSRLFITKCKVLWSQLLEEKQKKVRAKEHVEVEVVDPKGGEDWDEVEAVEEFEDACVEFRMGKVTKVVE
ncbi:hypothetical protein CK203_013051 [Vitis vinifera]|uniref:Uncharacterized protein n=1 Tax=Vitis vinifera TaxID=29760 RepID=A0A438JLJ8_VITVI|nr:hypothetical protein CK203_013051 [Vitis vinifera]